MTNRFNPKFIFSMTLAAGLALVLPAKDASAHGGRDRCGLSTVTLDQTQQDNVDQLRSDFRDAAAALRDDDSLSREERREAFRTLRQQLRTDIDALLTDDQKAEIETCKQEAQAERINRKVERLTEALNLEAPQPATIRSILEQAAADKKALRETFEGTHDELREQMQTLRDQTKAQIRDVLTTEQQAQFDELELRKGRRRNRGNRRGRRGGRR